MEYVRERAIPPAMEDCHEGATSSGIFCVVARGVAMAVDASDSSSSLGCLDPLFPMLKSAKPTVVK